MSVTRRQIMVWELLYTRPYAVHSPGSSMAPEAHRESGYSFACDHILLGVNTSPTNRLILLSTLAQIMDVRIGNLVEWCMHQAIVCTDS